MNNPLYKGSLILGSGTAVAQLIAIVSMPIITRLYTPSDLGTLAVYSSILAIVGIINTLGYETAIQLPKEDEDAANVFGLCLIILSLTTAGFALILFFGGELLIETFDLGLIKPYFWLLVFGFFGIGLYNILNYWAIRQRDYKKIARTKISQGAGGAVCKILLGILSFGPVGLILGHIVTQIAGISTLALAMLSKERKNLNTISSNGMMKNAKKYKSFPKFFLPASIVNVVSLQIPALMLLTMYDSQVVGFYSLAYSLVALPVSAISSSLSMTFLGEMSRMVRERSPLLGSFYLKTTKHLALIALPLIGLPAFICPFVVPIIFGESWTEAGWYCLPISLMVISSFIVSTTSNLKLLGYNHWKLIYDIIRLSAILLGFYASYLFKLPVLLTLLIYSVILAIMYLVSFIINIKAIKNFTKLLEKTI